MDPKEEVPKSQSEMVEEEMNDSFNAHLTVKEEPEEEPVPAEESK